MNNRLLLILKYLWDKSDENNPATISHIIQYLSHHNMTADRKTVARYIDTLIDFGIDIIKVRKTQNQYFIGTRHFEAPEVKLLHEGMQYLVSPYDLIWSSDAYYLAGFHEAKKRREFELSQMRLPSAVQSKRQSRFILFTLTCAAFFVCPVRLCMTIKVYASLAAGRHFLWASVGCAT